MYPRITVVVSTVGEFLKKKKYLQPSLYPRITVAVSTVSEFKKNIYICSQEDWVPSNEDLSFIVFRVPAYMKYDEKKCYLKQVIIIAVSKRVLRLVECCFVLSNPIR